MNFHHTCPTSSQKQSVPLIPISTEDEKVKDEQPSLLCADAGKNRDTSVDREETQCSPWVTSICSFFLNSGNTLFASVPFIPFPVSSAYVSSRFDEAKKERELGRKERENIMKTAQKERKIIMEMIDLRSKKSDLLVEKVLALMEKANEEKVSAIQKAIQRVEAEIAAHKRKIAEGDESPVS